MKDCDRIEKLICEGGELPPQGVEHVGHCRSCARALDENRRLASLLKQVSAVPPATDCRSAVAARISGTERRDRVAWAYGFGLAAVVAAGIALFYTVHTQPGPTSSVPVRIAAPPTAPPNLPSRTVGEHVHPVTVEVAERPDRERPRAFAKRPVVRRAPKMAAVRERVAPPEAEADGRPVAIVLFTWPTPGAEVESGYRYVTRDEETGETTTCSVKRSAGSVEIHLESSPGKETPGRGTKANETHLADQYVLVFGDSGRVPILS